MPYENAKAGASTAADADSSEAESGPRTRTNRGTARPSVLTADDTRVRNLGPEQERELNLGPEQAAAQATPQAAAAAPPRRDLLRVNLSGPDTRTLDFTPNADGSVDVTIDQLPAGTYSVELLGIDTDLGGELVSEYGISNSVTVVSDQTSNAVISFGSFLPVIDPTLPAQTSEFAFDVDFSAVPTATGYFFELDTDPSFSNPTTLSTTGTNVIITVVAPVANWMRVRAENTNVPATQAKPSDPVLIDVVIDVNPTGTDNTTAPSFGVGRGANGQYGNYNIYPATDEDWFAIDLTTDATLTVDVLTESLTSPPSGEAAPPVLSAASGTSPLDPVVDIYDPSLTVIATNDDRVTGTVESRVSDVPVPVDGRYFIRVTSFAQSTVGHYELLINVNAEPVTSVTVDPTTASILPSSTVQLTGRTFDQFNVELFGREALWSSSDDLVATVDGSGLVTGQSVGTATITFSSETISASATITVANAPSIAQFNVDIQRSDGQSSGLPSNSFGAAGVAGVWTELDVLAFGPQSMVDISGNPTGVTVTNSQEGCCGGRVLDNASTSGDDEALLDDGWNALPGVGVAVVFTIDGLAATTYTVYTYAWDPAFPSSRSATVDVNGVGAVLVAPTSDNFPGYVAGQTHSVHTVSLGVGEPLVITVTNAADVFDQNTVNGFQIVAGSPSSPQWIQLAPTGTPPTGRSNHATFYDETTNQMVAFGGRAGLTNLNDLWSLTDANGVGSPTWSSVSPSGGPPAGRWLHEGVYDAANNRMIVFGGAFGSTSPCSADVWVLSNANGVGETPTWTQLLPAAGPAPRANPSMVYDAASNRLTVFGGNDCFATYYSDAWVLTNANGLGGTPTWTPLTPGTPINSARQGHEAGYDPGSNRMIVFGGGPVATPFLNDVWVLTNANGLGGTPNWMQLAPSGTLPPGRNAFAAVYDVSTNRMTIFGGSNSATQLNDVWVLSGANGLTTPMWTQLAPTGTAPLPMNSFSAVYDPGTNRMIIFGGNDGVTAFNDVWVLTGANGQ